MITGKNIVITGALQGIGKETVKVFAENGANIFACAYEEQQDFIDFCGELEKENHVRVIPVFFDMSDNDSIKKGIKEIQKEKMEIHGLVNVAGINKDALFSMITQRDMEESFQINVFSQIILSQYIVRLMRKNNTEGSIVFTSSVTAMDGNRGQTTYGASKAALIGAMKSMALELGEIGIRVNAVAPGVIMSPMTQKLDRDVIDKKLEVMDIPRLGTTTEVANVYMYLMSDYASHVTGQTFRVDGGMR